MIKWRLGVTRFIVGVAITSVAAGCSSAFVPLTPRLPENPTTLGHASGRACGMTVPYAGAEQFLPIMVASRTDRAYDQALKSVAGATALQDVTVEEDWLWPVLGLYICTTISGEAVR